MNQTITIANRQQVFVPSYDIVAQHRARIEAEREAERAKQAERVAQANYAAMGGDLLEMGLCALVGIATMAITQALTLTERLAASATPEGRERYTYDINYWQDGKFRAIVNATANAARKQERDIAAMINRQMHRTGLTDMPEQCADMADTLEEALAPVTDAIGRYIIARQCEINKVARDPWALADVIKTVVLTNFAHQCYQFVAQKSLPAIDHYPIYRSLNCNKLAAQCVKLTNTIDVRYEDGTDIDYPTFSETASMTELLTDLSKMFLSVELLSRLLGCIGIDPNTLINTANGRKSIVDGFQDSTMSLNYYKQHYTAKWPLDKMRRKRTNKKR